MASLNISKCVDIPNDFKVLFVFPNSFIVVRRGGVKLELSMT